MHSSSLQSLLQHHFLSCDHIGQQAIKPTPFGTVQFNNSSLSNLQLTFKFTNDMYIDPTCTFSSAFSLSVSSDTMTQSADTTHLHAVTAATTVEVKLYVLKCDCIQFHRA